MKRRIILLNAIALLLCISGCKPDTKNKGRIAKDIPECIRQSIEEDFHIIGCKEYCNADESKKIYHLVEDFYVGIIMHDENCNFILIQSEEHQWITSPNTDFDFVFGYLLPDGTVDYEGDIYHFKRIVFTKK